MRASLVLLPYGLPPLEAHRDLCTQFLLRAGGDIDRMIDQPTNDVDRFGRYVARIPVLRTGTNEVPLVLLTRTSPLPLTVFNARRILETHVPSLHGARWMLFVTEEDDPFFEDGARRLGSLSGDLASNPVWSAPQGIFLVTSPLGSPDDVAERVAQLDGATGRSRRSAPAKLAAGNLTAGLRSAARSTRARWRRTA